MKPITVTSINYKNIIDSVSKINQRYNTTEAKRWKETIENLRFESKDVFIAAIEHATKAGHSDLAFDLLTERHAGFLNIRETIDLLEQHSGTLSMEDAIKKLRLEPREVFVDAVIHAAKKGYSYAVDQLLKHRTPADTDELFIQGALRELQTIKGTVRQTQAEVEDTKRLKTFLEKTIPVNKKAIALMHAIERSTSENPTTAKENAEAAADLIELGVDPNTIIAAYQEINHPDYDSTKNVTALDLAVSNSSTAMMKMLLASKKITPATIEKALEDRSFKLLLACENFGPKEMEDALMSAIEHGNIDVIGRLLTSEKLDYTTAKSVLELAVANNHHEVVKALLSSSEKIKFDDAKDIINRNAGSHGDFLKILNESAVAYTALNEAAKKGETARVQELLGLGVNPSIISSYTNYQKYVESLDTSNLRDADDFITPTAFDVAMDHPEVMKVLLAASPFDPISVQTAFIEAVKNGDPAIIEVFLDSQAVSSIQQQSPEVITAIMRRLSPIDNPKLLPHKRLPPETAHLLKNFLSMAASANKAAMLDFAFSKKTSPSQDEVHSPYYEYNPNDHYQPTTDDPYLMEIILSSKVNPAIIEQALARTGSPIGVKTLLACKNFTPDKAKETLLFAVKKEHPNVEVVNLLLSSGKITPAAAIEAFKAIGDTNHDIGKILKGFLNTQFDAMVTSGNHQAIQDLLTSEAINRENIGTGLNTAAQKGKLDIVKSILKSRIVTSEQIKQAILKANPANTGIVKDLLLSPKIVLEDRKAAILEISQQRVDKAKNGFFGWIKGFFAKREHAKLEDALGVNDAKKSATLAGCLGRLGINLTETEANKITPLAGVSASVQGVSPFDRRIATVSANLQATLTLTPPIVHTGPDAHEETPDSSHSRLTM